MRKIIINSISIIMSFIITLSTAYGFSYAIDCENVILSKGNSEFGIDTATMIKKFDENKDKIYTQSVSENSRIIGKVKNGINDIEKYNFSYVVLNKDNRFVMQFKDCVTLRENLSRMYNDKNIIYVVEDSVVFSQSVEEKSENYYSWGVEALGMDKYSECLQHSELNSSVTIAVVDSGVADVGCISDKLVTGYDFLDNDNDATNDTSSDSHGTFLGSIIADSTKNLPIKIMPIRVLLSGSGMLSNAINGIYYAVDNGADIINFSLGGTFGDCSALDEAMKYADSHGVIIVVCSGNKKMNTNKYCPAHNRSVITVSSVNKELEFSSDFSNFGDEVDCCAPGEKILGLSADGNKKTMSGTSMSAAFVSAGAAMFKLKHYDCNPEQVQGEIKKVCIDLGEEGVDDYYGYGIPDFSSFSDNKKIYVRGISLKEENIELTVGEKKKFDVVFSPSDAEDKSVIWKTSNNKIAVADENGVISFVNTGECYISVTANDGGYTASCKVKVLPRNHIIKWIIDDIILCQEIKTGEIIISPIINGRLSDRFVRWDRQLPDFMPDEDMIFNAVLKSVEDSCLLNIASEKKIDYRSIVTITATATDVPEGYHLALYVNGAKVKDGDNKSVSYTYGEIKSDINYTVKVIDANGKVQKDGSGNDLSKDSKVTVNAGFFKKLVAFFKWLFKTLPQIEVKP